MWFRVGDFSGSREIILIGLVTPDRKLKARREGSK